LLFLLGTKNNVLSALMGRGYEKLNFLHRWAGRGMFLSATIHGSLWIRSHIILGVSFNQDKERHGLSAYAVLGTILLTSLWPVRSRAYRFFFVFQYVNPAFLQNTNSDLGQQYYGPCSFLHYRMLSYAIRTSLDLSAVDLLRPGPFPTSRQVPLQTSNTTCYRHANDTYSH
jgi:hypothetical protein